MAAVVEAEAEAEAVVMVVVLVVVVVVVVLASAVELPLVRGGFTGRAASVDEYIAAMESAS